MGAYPFNSQVLELEDGSMAIVAPEDSREEPAARAFLCASESISSFVPSSFVPVKMSC